jgi:HEAT repeat protein
VDADRVLRCGTAVTDDRQPRKCWIRQLRRGDEEALRQALAALEPDTEEEEYKDIVQLLGDNNSRTREEVSSWLVKKGEEAVFPLMQEVTGNQNNNFRGAVVEVLKRIGDPAIDGLTAMLQDAQKPREIRSNAVQALGKLASPGNQRNDDILRALQSQRDSDIGTEVARTIEETRQLANEEPLASPRPATKPTRPPR